MRVCSAHHRRLAGSDAADRAPLMNTRTDTQARERGLPRRHPDLDRRLTPSRAASNCDATRLDFFQHLSQLAGSLNTRVCCELCSGMGAKYINLVQKYTGSFRPAFLSHGAGQIVPICSSMNENIRRVALGLSGATNKASRTRPHTTCSPFHPVRSPTAKQQQQ